MSNLFVKIARTRESKFTDNFTPPAFNYLFYKNSYHYRAINAWKDLPPNVKCIQSISRFKSELQNLLNMNPKKKTVK